MRSNVENRADTQRKAAAQPKAEPEQQALSPEFADNRPETMIQRRLHESANPQEGGNGIAQRKAVPAFPIQRQTAVLQRRAETVSVTGMTHLVEIDGSSLMAQEDRGRPVRSGDLVTIDRAKKKKSRRGPNQEDDSLRAEDEQGPHIYKYFRVLELNGKAVDGEVYLRDRTFNVSDDTHDYEADREQLVEARQKLQEFQSDAAGLLRTVGAIVDDDNPEKEAIDAAVAQMLGVIAEGDEGTLPQIMQRLGQITGAMQQLSTQAKSAAYSLLDASRVKGTDGDTASQKAAQSRGMIQLADEAFLLVDQGQQIRVSLEGGEYTTFKDAMADGFGMFDTAQTGVMGLLGGGISTTVGLAQGAESFAAGFATGFGYVATPVGIICGAITAGVGLKNVYRGYSSEKELKALMPHLSDEQIQEVAAFAKEKKRKKKLGGGINAAVGGIVLVAGGIGILAMVVASAGVAALVFGIIAGLVGIGLVLGKWWHRRKKRKNWRKTMANMVLDAYDEGDTAAFPADLFELAAAVREAPEDAAAMKALEDACVAKADSRRQLLAQKTLHLLLNGSPAQQYEAERLVEVLHLKPEKVRQKAQSDGNGVAAEMISNKMKSW